MSKKKSKRMTIHLQNKIKKKVTEARRKQRKEARLKRKSVIQHSTVGPLRHVAWVCLQ